MSAIEYERPSFELRQLWSDQRYRSIVVQIFFLIGLLAFIAFIVNNTINNLQQLGVETGYDFLFEPANYDINQRLIDYTSRSTHGRAAIVGILNTFVVAIAGIITATIIGFIAGVLRLSHNWLISRLVYVYVEITRNVPVLLQILLWHGIIVHSLPRPKNALEPVSGMFLSNRGFSIPRPMFEAGMWAVLAGFLVAVVFAIGYSRYATRQQAATGKIYPVASVAIAAIVGLPLIVFFVAGMPAQLEWPELRGFNFASGVTITPEFVALWFALSIYTAAFIAEIVRAGIQSVSHGQTEAARALGLRPSWTTRLVILPQALRVIIPPLISQYLNLTKNSSLAIVIGYMDIVATIGGITLNQTGRALESMSIVLSIYLAISLSISLLMNIYNKRVALVER